MDELSKIPVYLWLILGIALLTQSAWIFWDSSKRGENKWLWGFYGILNIPSSLIIYLLVTRIILKPKPCMSCKKNIRGNYEYCPHCGEKITN